MHKLQLLLLKIKTAIHFNLQMHVISNNIVGYYIYFCFFLQIRLIIQHEVSMFFDAHTVIRWMVLIHNAIGLYISNPITICEKRVVQLVSLLIIILVITIYFEIFLHMFFIWISVLKILRIKFIYFIYHI